MGATHIVRLAEMTSLLWGGAWDIESMIAFRALQGLLGGPMIPTVFATAFIYFSGHQRMIAAATIGGWSSFAANRTSVTSCR